MGQEINNTLFTRENEITFRENLRRETKLLKGLFEQDSFEKTNGVCGLEMEAWLVDQNFLPSPSNTEFLNDLKNPLVVHEISKFNIEFNNAPEPFGPHMFRNMQRNITKTWDQSHSLAEKMNLHLLSIGILPTLRDDMLRPEFLSESHRYKALTERILNLRKNKPIHVKIEGVDQVKTTHHDLMMESGCTSLQIHLQVNQAQATKAYNASQIISAPLVAISANSPYLYGKELWEETRIPLFEQAVDIGSFRDHLGRMVGRVTFGTGYARQSMLEPFLENLDGYPVLLPVVFENEIEKLEHLKLHNGSIWRWNRPIVGHGPDGTHIRIEQRVSAAGPTIVDSIANAAFFMGLAHYLINNVENFEDRIPFEVARENFYSCAKVGLNSTLTWFDGEKVSCQNLLVHKLIPMAREGLEQMGVESSDIELYLNQIILKRALSGQTGSSWQRKYIQKHGPRFQQMTQDYWRLSTQGSPVHSWAL